MTEALEVVSSTVADGSQLDFRTLLMDAQLIIQEDIQMALELAASNPRILAQILTQTGYLTALQSEIILECHEAITQNTISQHDAKFVLDFCLQKLTEGTITFTEGLHELGWTKTEESTEPSSSNKPVYEHTETTPTQTPPQPMANSGNFLGTALPGANNQSFLPSSNIDFSNQANPAAQTKPQPSPQPQKPQLEKHTGRTTSNMPAINLQAGSELYPHVRPKPPSNRKADQSHSLKSLLEEDDEPGSQLTDSANNETAKANESVNGAENKKGDDGLELSDSEKALIMKASSLTASPQEIMAAMKLAAKKDKTLNSIEKLKIPEKEE